MGYYYIIVIINGKEYQLTNVGPPNMIDSISSRQLKAMQLFAYVEHNFHDFFIFPEALTEITYYNSGTKIYHFKYKNGRYIIDEAVQTIEEFLKA
jgi:hypothetical protein